VTCGLRSVGGCSLVTLGKLSQSLMMPCGWSADSCLELPVNSSEVIGRLAAVGRDSFVLCESGHD